MLWPNRPGPDPCTGLSRASGEEPSLAVSLSAPAEPRAVCRCELRQTRDRRSRPQVEKACGAPAGGAVRVPTLPLGSLSQLPPLPPSRLRDGWPPSPGPPKSDGRTEVAGIMGLLKPLQGPSLSPGTSGDGQLRTTAPGPRQLWRRLPEDLLPARTELQGKPRASPSAGEPWLCARPPLGTPLGPVPAC